MKEYTFVVGDNVEYSPETCTMIKGTVMFVDEQSGQAVVKVKKTEDDYVLHVIRFEFLKKIKTLTELRAEDKDLFLSKVFTSEVFAHGKGTPEAIYELLSSGWLKPPKTDAELLRK